MKWWNYINTKLYFAKFILVLFPLCQQSHHGVVVKVLDWGARGLRFKPRTLLQKTFLPKTKSYPALHICDSYFSLLEMSPWCSGESFGLVFMRSPVQTPPSASKNFCLSKQNRKSSKQNRKLSPWWQVEN